MFQVSMQSNSHSLGLSSYSPAPTSHLPPLKSPGSGECVTSSAPDCPVDTAPPYSDKSPAANTWKYQSFQVL